MRQEFKRYSAGNFDEKTGITNDDWFFKTKYAIFIAKKKLQV